MNRNVAGVALLFISYHLGGGVLMPYLPLWLQERALSADQIALVLAVPAILRVLTTPVFAHIGDTFGKRLIILALGISGLVGAVLLYSSTALWSIAIWTSVVYICWQSMPLQVDAIAIDLVRKGLASSYGTMRAFGSTAFIAANGIGALALEAAGADGILICFMVSAVLVLGVASRIPKDAGGAPEAAGEIMSNVWLQPKLVSVMVPVALVIGSHNAFMNFGAIIMREIGLTNATIGMVFAASTAAEVLMFFLGPLVSRRLSPLQWIGLGAGVTMLRWILTATVHDPALQIATQLLQALSFSGTYMGMISYLVGNVDQRQMARAQGIYVALFGAFSAILTFGIGQIFDRYGSESFLLAACLPAAALVILAVRQYLLRLER